MKNNIVTNPYTTNDYLPGHYPFDVRTERLEVDNLYYVYILSQKKLRIQKLIAKTEKYLVFEDYHSKNIITLRYGPIISRITGFCDERYFYKYENKPTTYKRYLLMYIDKNVFTNALTPHNYIFNSKEDLEKFLKYIKSFKTNHKIVIATKEIQIKEGEFINEA